jgi:hypothetical protein
MSFTTKIKGIVQELRNHAPFTIMGAISGIILMVAFKDLNTQTKSTLFSLFHPAHVFLSAMVTASLFQLHRKARQFLIILLIGYIGSIGIATLSDCIIPFFGESILGVAIPSHAESHITDAAHDDHNHSQIQAETEQEDGHADHDGHSTGTTENVSHGEDHETCDHKPHLHLGFIEEWYLVNPAAVLGVIVAFFVPRSRYPHAAHVLVSTWASSAHILMNTQADMTAQIIAGIFIVLFIAVWLPCCISDIVFPMLFVDVSKDHSHCWLCPPHEEKSPDDPYREDAS